MDIVDIAGEYAKLHVKKKELKAELKKIEDAMSPLQQKLFDDFSHRGVDSIAVDGVLLYTSSQLWAGKAEGVENREAVKALEAAGLEEYTTMNYQSLSALMREWEANDAPLPPELDGIIAPYTKYTIKARKS